MRTFASLGDLAGQFDKLATSMSGAGKSAVVVAQAKAAQPIAAREFAKDIGSDLKFTHWAPTMDTQVKVVAPGKAVIAPTRTGAGPITVLNQGRHQGNASGFSGPGVNIRTGLTSRTKSGGIRKQRATKGGRWNGRTDGKGSADRAVRAFDVELPKVGELAQRQVISKFFDLD